MFKDEELKSLIIIDKKTKEIYAMITKDGEVVQKKDIVVIEDYSNNEEIIEEKYGRFYYKGVE